VLCVCYLFSRIICRTSVEFVPPLPQEKLRAIGKDENTFSKVNPKPNLPRTTRIELNFENLSAAASGMKRERERMRGNARESGVQECE